MTSVHSVRPTDLVALVAFDGRVYPNEAVTRDRIGKEAEPHLLETALEQWFSFATGRHAWISVRGATLRGLVSARRRGSKAAWEVDGLIDAADDDPGVIMSLLDQAAADAGEAGAEKLFLRVPAASTLMRTASSAGFTPYLSERLLAASQPETGSQALDDSLTLRRWTRADAEPTFRLYNRWAPERVRRIEAVTFREWLATRERASSPRNTRQAVLERDGKLAGWLRTAHDGTLGRFDLMADATGPDTLDALVDAALSRLRKRSPIFALVPDYAVSLHDHLRERDFAEVAEYALMMRRTARPVAEYQAITATPS